MNKPNKKTGSQKARKSDARRMAVQTVYQMHKNDHDADTAIKEYLEHRAGVDPDGDEMVSPDQDHFSLVVRGVAEHMEQLADMVQQNRRKELNNHEPLLNAVLLCGAFELMVLQAIDFPLIIADYLHVTHAFFDKGEAKLVNGLLDSIRQTVRS